MFSARCIAGSCSRCRLAKPNKGLLLVWYAESLCQRAACGQIDAEPLESVPQVGTVAVEEVAQTYQLHIGAPREEQVEQVPSPRSNGGIQRAGLLEVRGVAVAQQEEQQGVFAGRRR